jgi:hypothetical protein
MSIKRMVAVWELSKQKGSALLVLLSLADRADDDGYCWPGMDDTAERARVTRRHAIRVIRTLEESGELYVNQRPGYPHEYVVPHGLSPEDFHGVMKRRFSFKESETNEILARMTGCDILSPLRGEGVTFAHKGDDTGVMGGVTPMSHESSLTTINETSLTEFSRISAVFWTASHIPPPNPETTGWDEWKDGTERLLKMKPTEEEINEAVKLLDSKGYAYRNPGSLVNTIGNTRKKKERVQVGQSLGGQFVE